ncbi:transcriptional regulator, TetR family [Cupriavidus sp. OV038]|jgi:AcrR family transcriptional regulator|uniref:TetR/AcrR family transcriptional regulator n=2 Tax=Pseudomonadota TaxID=1224 RepID=UPI0008E0E5CA|nr:MULTISPECIES: TetR/AcrR family transcriptional regulator [unclassified Cupriavidus]SFC11678.1 transcriptional regulator, TetR family [Cupriavidus sp. OV038]SFP07587.1 transcriptional regulator, TetR family [Cupriavidus sp. OV096]
MQASFPSVTNSTSSSTAFPRIDTPSILQPPRQRRAKETEQALLTAGRELLAQRDFASVSVAQIAAACQVSVGAFYGRFRDKMAFFDALRTLVMEETDASVARYLNEGRWAETPPRQIVEKTMRFLLTGCHNNRGVIRASLKHATTRPEEWLPHQKNGQEIVDRLVALLVPRLPGPPEEAEQRVRFAMQVVFGMIVNAVLNDPGPLTLADERLPVELTRMVASYLDL